MGNLFKIAIRNLIRYKRRTILTGSLVAIGIIFVLVFVAAPAIIRTIYRLKPPPEGEEGIMVSSWGGD